MTTLGSLLVQNHVVGVVDIEKALQRQVIMGGDLATNMLELSLAKEDALAKYTARAFGMPLLDRTLLDAPDEKLIRMIPWAVAEQHRIVPVNIEGNVMTVATFQPLQEHALEEVAFLLGVEFAPHFVLEFRLAIALNRCYGIPIPPRFEKLQTKLAPETQTGGPPIYPRPTDESAMVVGVDPRGAATEKEDDGFRDEANTVPADTDYVETVKETATEAPRTDFEVESSGDISIEVTVPDALPEPEPMPEPAGAAAEPPEPDKIVEDIETIVSEPDQIAQDIETVVFDSDKIAQDAETVVFDSDKIAQDVEIGDEAPDKPEEEDSASESPSAPPAKPLDFEAIHYRLLQVTHRNEIVDTFMESLKNVFEYAMLFVIQGKDAHAHVQMTTEGKIERVDSPVLAVDSGGMLEIAYNTRSFYLGQPGKDDTDRLLLHEMNRRKLRNCAIVPVTLRNRIIMLLYGDSGVKGVKATQMSDLSQLVRLVSEAFERLLLEKKYGQYRAESTEMPSKPIHPAFSKLPSGRLSDMPHSAGLYRFVNADESGKLRPSMAAAAHNTDSFGRYSPGGSYEEAFQQERSAAARRRMAGMASLVQSLAPGRPTFGAGPDPIRPPAHVEFGEDEVKTSRIISVTSGEPPRSVVVNMTEEIDRLVSRVISSKRYDKVAVEVLVGIGDDAVAKLVEHFPGPLLFDRHQHTTGMIPKVSRHGHLLKALTKFGKIAVPHLLPLLSSHDSDVRFYATFLFSELKFPEALDTLTERLFDPDRHIRAIAVDVIRGFGAHPEYRWAVKRIIGALESPDGDLETKYLATKALGELGEPVAVEPLTKLLDSADETLVKMAHRALTKIVLFDHGFTDTKWLEWYEENKTRSRIEWAMDGLVNEDPDIRELSFMALKVRIDDVLEDSEMPATLREFKELQDRLKTWWKDEGKEIHQLVEGS